MARRKHAAGDDCKAGYAGRRRATGRHRLSQRRVPGIAIRASDKMISERGTVPFSSPGTGKLEQSPIILSDALNFSTDLTVASGPPG